MEQRSTLVGCFIILLLAFSSCNKKEEAHRVTSKDELYIFLDSLEKRYEVTGREMQLASWNSYSRQGTDDRYAAQSAFAKIFEDTTARNLIEEWRNRSGSLADKLLARRLELWHRCFMGGAIYFDSKITLSANSLAQKVSNFKFSIDRKSVSWSSFTTLLKDEKKQAQRHKLWLLTNQLASATKNDYIRLVKMYNEKAQAFGFPNYYSLLLHLQAIDERWLAKTLTSLEELTRPDYEKMLITIKKKLRIKQLGTWDVEYIQPEAIALPDKYFPADSLKNMIHHFEKAIGFATDTLHIAEVIKDHSTPETCFVISVPNDVRLLLYPNTGFNYFSTGFRQYGRALHAVHTKVDYPILKGYTWTPGTNCPAFYSGAALMHGEFVEDSLWLGTTIKPKEKEIKQYLGKRNLPLLFQLRRQLSEFFTEYEIYKNPDLDLDSIKQTIQQNILLIDTTSEENTEFFPLLSAIASPCNSHTIILEEMIADQLHEALSTKFGNEKISNPKVAGWVIEYLYKSGETLEWYERIRNATGKSVEPGAYLRKLGIDHTNLITKEIKE